MKLANSFSFSSGAITVTLILNSPSSGFKSSPDSGENVHDPQVG